ncbi:MAG TPA: helix-turn-helix transcriptional regulator [Vicinamibacterales bacterium]
MSSTDLLKWSSGYDTTTRSVLLVEHFDFAPFRALLDEGEELFATQKEFAEAIGINPTRYSKMARGDAYTLNVRNCLSLAGILKRAPTEVLRAAGKGDIADLLDQLYGVQQYAPLPGGTQGRELAAEWARMSPEQRGIVLTVIRQLPKVASPSVAAVKATAKKPARTARRG